MKIKLGVIPVSWTMGKGQTEVGQKLPDFTVENDKGKELKTKDILAKGSEMTLISVVPNLKTKTCSLETKRFNDTASKYKGVKFVTISNNTIDEQKDWCAAKGVKNIEILSDKKGSFGKAMHLYIPVFGHLARVVFLVNSKGEVVYRQVVGEISDQPNYAPITKQLNKLAK